MQFWTLGLEVVDSAKKRKKTQKTSKNVKNAKTPVNPCFSCFFQKRQISFETSIGIFPQKRVFFTFLGGPAGPGFWGFWTLRTRFLGSRVGLGSWQQEGSERSKKHWWNVIRSLWKASFTRPSAWVCQNKILETWVPNTGPPKRHLRTCNAWKMCAMLW